jgi:hypothetical protein
MDFGGLDTLSSSSLFQAVKKRKEEQDNFMSNPLNRLSSTFGFSQMPGVISADEIFGGPATQQQTLQIDMINDLLGVKKKDNGLVGGLLGKVLQQVGPGISKLAGLFI